MKKDHTTGAIHIYMHNVISCVNVLKSQVSTFKKQSFECTSIHCTELVQLKLRKREKMGKNQVVIEKKVNNVN